MITTFINVNEGPGGDNSWRRSHVVWRKLRSDQRPSQWLLEDQRDETAGMSRVSSFRTREVQSDMQSF